MVKLRLDFSRAPPEQLKYFFLGFFHSSFITSVLTIIGRRVGPHLLGVRATPSSVLSGCPQQCLATKMESATKTSTLIYTLNLRFFLTFNVSFIFGFWVIHSCAQRLHTALYSRVVHACLRSIQYPGIKSGLTCKVLFFKPRKCSGLTPDFTLRDRFWSIQDSNPDWPCSRHESYLLYYRSSPLFLSPFTYS